MTRSKGEWGGEVRERLRCRLGLRWWYEMILVTRDLIVNLSSRSQNVAETLTVSALIREENLRSSLFQLSAPELVIAGAQMLLFK